MYMEATIISKLEITVGPTSWGWGHCCMELSTAGNTTTIFEPETRSFLVVTPNQVRGYRVDAWGNVQKSGKFCQKGKTTLAFS